MTTLNDELSLHLAEQLLNIGAVTLSPRNPFTWASGLRSPVYCDNRLTLAYPELRREITHGFIQVIEKYNIACDSIAGIATAGIPHAAWLAERSEKPMAYVRGVAKSHGRRNRIEGRLESGTDVVLVEDLVSTGMSSTAAISPVLDAGCRVSAVLAIFTYSLATAREAFQRAGVPLYTLTDFLALIEVARLCEAIDDDELLSLRNWYEDPIAWSDKNS